MNVAHEANPSDSRQPSAFVAMADGEKQRPTARETQSERELAEGFVKN